MEKLRSNVGLIVLGIFVAMFFVVVPSLAIAGAGAMEGLGDICDDVENPTPPPDYLIIFQKAGGPVFLGEITVMRVLEEPGNTSGDVFINGSISKQGDKCTVTFQKLNIADPGALYTCAVNDTEWNGLKDSKGHNMVGLRLGIDDTQDEGMDPDNCVYLPGCYPQCFEIMAVGKFNLINDNMFSAFFVLMPME